MKNGNARNTPHLDRTYTVPIPYLCLFVGAVPIPYLYRTYAVPTPYLPRTYPVPIQKHMTVPIPYLYRTYNNSSAARLWPDKCCRRLYVCRVSFHTCRCAYTPWPYAGTRPNSNNYSDNIRDSPRTCYKSHKSKSRTRARGEGHTKRNPEWGMNCAHPMQVGWGEECRPALLFCSGSPPAFSLRRLVTTL